MQLIRQEEAYLIWRTSWVCILSTLYAAYRGHWELVPVPGGVFLTSILYWSKPNDMFYRRLDMTYVISSFMYQNYIAWGAENALPYYVLYIITCACFPISRYLFQAGYRWESFYIHAMMHILANLCNCILYSGELRRPLALAAAAVA